MSERVKFRWLHVHGGCRGAALLSRVNAGLIRVVLSKTSLTAAVICDSDTIISGLVYVFRYPLETSVLFY